MHISKRKLKKVINELTNINKNIAIKRAYGICPLEIINILLKYEKTKI